MHTTLRYIVIIPAGLEDGDRQCSYRRESSRPMEERFYPPGIDASHTAWMAVHMGVEHLLINNGATGDNHQNGSSMQAHLPYKPFDGPGERLFRFFRAFLKRDFAPAVTVSIDL